MPRYEYKVVPAPRKGRKQRGAKTAEERFAIALAAVMNEMGAEGWEYQRAETLPAEEKGSWISRPATVTHNVLVFRRALPEAAAMPEPLPDTAPEPQLQRPRPVAEPPLRLAPAEADATLVPVRRESPEGQAPRLGPAKGGRSPFGAE